MARMPIKDVEKAMADGTAVAVQTSLGIRPGIVEAVRQPRRVYSGARWDMGGHNAHDGIQVRFTPKTDAPEEVKVFGPKDVLGHYEAVATTVASLRQREEERKAALAELKTRADAVAAQIPGAHVKQVYANEHRHNFTVVSYRIEISVAAAEGLVA